MATKPATPIALLRGELLELRAVDAERRRVPARTDTSAAVPVEPSPPAWRRWAACRNADTAVFYPTRGDQRSQLMEALAFCDRCAVRAECLEEALVEESGVLYRSGIRGGLTASERERIAPPPTDTPVCAPVAVVASGRATRPHRAYVAAL